MTKEETQDAIKEVTGAMCDLLLYKNGKYGNSALEPLGLFHKGSAESAIAIRLDDKLSRVKNSQEGLRTNDICDIIGYLVLLLVSKGVERSDIMQLKD